MTRRLRSLIFLALALMAFTTAGTGACSGAGSQGSVSLLGTEPDQFKSLRERFEAKTGIKVSYQYARAQDRVLFADAQNGTPPDVAAISSPGELASNVRYLKPLDTVVGLHEYSLQWQKMALAGLDRLYAVPVEVNLKSIVWFNKKSWPQPPVLETLKQLSAPQPTAADGRPTWCMGLSSGAASGWPGTDWIEDILLQRSGKEVYEKWATGKLPWNAPEMKEAWTIWGTIATDPRQVRGGTEGTLLTSFEDAGRPMFGDSPSCLLEHQGSFIAREYQRHEIKPDQVGARDGLLHVWVPHATAGLAVIETGAGSDTDLLAVLRELLPADGRWRHGTAPPGTAGTTYCPPCCRPTPASRCSAGNSRWAPGSRSAWWTPMATTRSALSG